MITFVILHYKNIEDTIKCLESIKKLDGQDKISIVVVDNHTLSKDEAKKIEKYTKDIILLDDNLGFAKANNIGCLHAKEKYNSEYFVVLNNDTIVLQKDFVKRVETDYEKYKFDMLGPRIETIDGDSVNPFPVYKDITKVKEEIEKCKKLIKIYDSSFLTLLLNVYMKVKHLFKRPVKLKNSSVLETNVALHGCFLIFSKKYVNKYNYPFFNDTFLYHEEEFLYHRMKKDSLISIYDPDIKIFHKEGASLKYSFDKSVRLRKKFREEMRINSLKQLEKYLEG